MALYHFSAKMISRSSRNTVRALAYRAGCELSDTRTGQVFDYTDKPVQHVELLLPKDAPAWSVAIQKLIFEDRQKGVQAFSDIVEAAEKRMDAQVWREVEFALHRELTKEQNMALASAFVEEQICLRGMAAQLNFHFDVNHETGEETPHCHVVLPTRRLEEESLSLKKERDWNQKSLLLELRGQWEHYSNFHLKLHGHDVQIDHRSNKERGIEMEPQPKRGKGILEQEKREKLTQPEIQKKEITPRPFVTDKAKAFHEVQLRNLYRILRRPEVIFEIVTKHHATFMWADVQKKLHQYVNEAPLFERLEAKLQNSKELILLRLESGENSSENPEDKAIYTTRSMLRAEKSLVESAEALGHAKTHGVEVEHIEKAIAKADEDLKEHGGLSQDQITAIHHLVEEGQLKCVVGIAGAGKTTALGVCHDIWKEAGYAVYGLAPTGKAAQNLDQNGIDSTTLHKFLKSFAEGRCQYNHNSILVLDEAGMVDVERFEALLSTVKKLGVKLIVVGDGAQLQPVEAGPAFRLVTTRLGKTELNTVVRQKEDWQKEATFLFGKQQTIEAIQRYAEKGCVHVIEEKLPNFKELIANRDDEGLVKLYEVTHRVSSLIYREMAKAVQKNQDAPTSSLYPLIKQHQDYGRYLHWKAQEKEVVSFLKERELDHLIGVEKQKGQGIEVRQATREFLIKAWHSQFTEDPEKGSLMMAYSNKDVKDLNQSARALLKESGHLSKEEFVYMVKKEVEDDFGRKATLKEAKGFSKGDRIVFTRNTYGLGVKNGTMGTITDLNTQKIHVKLDEGKAISFAPNLNPYFDHGWAVTIHKSQGTTVDRAYVLASFEMNQNLAYVAMTRHRESVQIFGSSLDFWRAEKLPQVLAKSGEKLSAADYLDAESLTKLMQQDDTLLTKIFDRIAGELDALGTVSKKAFSQVADHFLGITREPEIRISPESIREEVRAEEVLQKTSADIPSSQERFADILKRCEKTLLDILAHDKRVLTPEFKERIALQSEKTADFIFHAHTLKGTIPTEEETELFFWRAKYELDRIPEIRKDIIKDWDRENNFDETKDGIIAHMIAERQASIEGRLYLEARQKGLEPPDNISDLAEQELQEHRTWEKELVQKASEKYGLSESAAIYCAKNVLRYKETHGEKPSEGQISAMVQIARELENREYAHPLKEHDSHEVEFLRRREGDLLFRQGCSPNHHDELPTSHELLHIQAQAKASLDATLPHMEQDLARMNQREMSL